MKIDDEATQYIDPAEKKTDTTMGAKIDKKDTVINTPAPESTVNKKDKKKSRLVSTAASAGTGVLIGGIAGVAMSMKSPEAVGESEVEETPNHSEVLSNPELVDDQVMVATTVTDEMSFGEAFAEARAEVGPGGVFEWHGNLYGTYTADEWASMSADEKAEYNNHFAWNNIDSSNSDIHGDYADVTITAEPVAEEGVEAVLVDEPMNEGMLYAQEVEQEPEIEVLGIGQDAETGSIYAGIEMGGQEAILVDIEGDGVFDVIVSDFNGDGEISQNEIIDIQDGNITVDDVLSTMNDNDNLMAGFDDAGAVDDGMIFDA